MHVYLYWIFVGVHSCRGWGSIPLVVVADVGPSGLSSVRLSDSHCTHPTGGLSFALNKKKLT